MGRAVTSQTQSGKPVLKLKCIANERNKAGENKTIYMAIRYTKISGKIQKQENNASSLHMK